MSEHFLWHCSSSSSCLKICSTRGESDWPLPSGVAVIIIIIICLNVCGAKEIIWVSTIFPFGVCSSSSSKNRSGCQVLLCKKMISRRKHKTAWNYATNPKVPKKDVIVTPEASKLSSTKWEYLKTPWVSLQESCFKTQWRNRAKKKAMFTSNRQSLKIEEANGFLFPIEVAAAAAGV